MQRCICHVTQRVLEAFFINCLTTSISERNVSKKCQSNMTTVSLHVTAYLTRKPAAHPVTHLVLLAMRTCTEIAIRLQCKQSCHLLECTKASSHTKQTHKAKPMYSLYNDTLFDGYHSAKAHNRWLWMALTFSSEGH